MTKQNRLGIGEREFERPKIAPMINTWFDMKIGTEFYRGRIRLKCVEYPYEHLSVFGIRCEDCFFQELNCCHMACGADERFDGKNVYFIKVDNND